MELPPLLRRPLLRVVGRKGRARAIPGCSAAVRQGLLLLWLLLRLLRLLLPQPPLCVHWIHARLLPGTPGRGRGERPQAPAGRQRRGGRSSSRQRRWR